ncbi:MAG: peptidoglycan DD-metalloendopeptidase family protein [Flavobacteriales bacterium]
MSEQNQIKKEKFLKRLKKRFRFVLLNEDTLEERISIRLTPLRVFTLAGLAIIFLIIITSYTIAFTPLREYIPGYADNVILRRQILELASSLDSLERASKSKDLYLENIRKVINDEHDVEETNAKQKTKKDPANLRLQAGEAESSLRTQIDKEDRYNISMQLSGKGINSIGNLYMFPPLKGKITTSFNPREKHYGIDIVAGKNEAVKATMDGTVVFSGWTSGQGYVIHMQHANNLMSIYQHNSALLKKQGDKVKAGEAIAITGNSGEITTGPHLHFEIWFDGKPIDPEEFIIF